MATTEYLWAFLTSSAAYHQASRTAGGSASPHVNIREIVAFLLPRAPLELQREFARRVHALDRQKAAMRGSLAHLDALFSALEYRAFHNGT
jgi:type I restriction enzyme S subunit